MSRIGIMNGRIIDPSNRIDRIANLLIEDGVFVEVTPDTPSVDEEIDATGKVVCPGFVDIHVHFREPGFEDSETLATGLASAVAGGFTTVACMPNTKPPIDSPVLVRTLRDKAVGLGLAHLEVVATVTRGQRGEGCSDYGALAEAGAVAFSDDGLPVANAALAESALAASKQFGLPVISHCEGCDRVHRGAMHEGATSKRLGIDGMSRAGEFEMVQRDIALAAKTGGHIHIAHVSTVESAEAIRRAKQKGIRVTAEVTPHHLTLTDHEIDENADAVYKVNPPLREPHDVTAMRDALSDGTLDAIACDHAPHTEQSKARPFEKAPFGMIGLETVLPVIQTRLVDESVISLTKMIELLTCGPARVFGLNAGTLNVGEKADVTMFDPDAAYTITASGFRSKGRNCPFDGWVVRGKVIQVWVEGKAVYYG